MSINPFYSTLVVYNYIKEYFAGVAELVDALDSGSSVRKDVRVRISPSAPWSEINQFRNKFTFGNKKAWVCFPYDKNPYFAYQNHIPWIALKSPKLSHSS